MRTVAGTGRQWRTDPGPGPHDALAVDLSSPWDLAWYDEALQFWRHFGPKAPEEFTDSALVFNAPADMPLPDSLRREPIVGIGGVYTGPLDAAESALAPLRRFQSSRR